MRHIFIDVGGHIGQSVAVALSPAFAFDLVHSFEPHPPSADILRERFADAITAGRLIVHQAALSDRHGVMALSGDNEKGGASVVPGMLAEEQGGVTVDVLDVAEFLRGFEASDRLYIKMNCEGGEVAIIERLASSGADPRIAAIMADFDIVKSGGGYWTKRRTVRRAIAAGLPIELAERVAVGKTHADRIANWLCRYPAINRSGLAPRQQPLKRVIRYAIRDLRSAVGINAKGYRVMGKAGAEW